MKVFKHISVIFLTLCLLFATSGCSDTSSRKYESNYSERVDGDITEYQDDVVPIYNAQNEEIGCINCYGYSALVNNSILYTRLPENTSSSKSLEYWLYDIETKDNYKLAVIDNWMYEASYDAIKDQDHLYLSVSTGEYSEFENGKQTIFDIDLLEHSMSPLIEIEGGVPYNSYTIANNKLILAELLYNGDTDLVEYDLNGNHSSTIVHAYDESDYFVHGSIRHIYADEKSIYMIRLDQDESDNYILYLDTYDFDYNLVNSVDLRDFCVSTNIELTEDSKVNEWKQFIAYFFVHNDLVYYQNFSATNAIGVMNGGKVDRLFNINSLFSYTRSVSNDNKSDLFIQSYGDNTDYRNIFYLVNPQTHEVRTAEFYADNPLYAFRSAFRDNDKILLTVGYVPFDKGERLPERLYYIDMNDLEFKLME